METSCLKCHKQQEVAQHGIRGGLSAFLPIDKTMTQTRESASLAIKDYGQGIEDVYIDSIFEKFSTVPSGSRSNPEGTGLGSAICKAIIEAHPGRFWVESVIGVSSTFYFSLLKTQQN
jgi:signal transduction histidine kinase